MAARAKLCFTIFLFSVLVIYVGLALATKDPELEQCKHQCRAQREFEGEQKEICERKCEAYYREKKQRQCQNQELEEEQGSIGGHPPEKQLQECQKQCERQFHCGGQEKQLCRWRCQQRYGREEQRGNYRRRDRERWEEEEEEEEEEEGGGRREREERNNPYLFEEHHFIRTVKTQHGSVRVLPRFTERSKLLWALKNYRLSILVANPQAFVQPNHFDADAIFFVTWGRGAITFIRENDRESFNVEPGDIIRVPAGTPFYAVNTHENEKLYIVKFLRTINLPGQYQVFYGPGGQNAESFFRAFSWEVLEAAFNVSRRELENVFEQQDQGSIIKASREQIRALSRREHGGSGGVWPFGGYESSKTSFNLFRKRPSHSNNFGKIFEADCDDFKPLQDLNFAISYGNISGGAMTAPFFNSKATKVGIVVAGEGFLEIACPHISSSSSGRWREHGTSYQKLSSPLRTDTVFVVPAGHPFVIVSSSNQNLEIACFEVNAEGNVRYPLAGTNNMFNFMHREAKELAFNARGEMVERVFGSQDEEYFFPGPMQQKHHQQQQGHAYE